jgi:hypothetical protein
MIKAAPYICSLLIHSILFIAIYYFLSAGARQEESINSVPVSREEAGVYEQVSGQNSMKSYENKKKIDDEFSQKYRAAYNNISETMKNNISNDNYRLDDFVKDVAKNQKIIDTNFSEHTRQMIDEDITNSILKNSADFIKKSIKEDIRKDLASLNNSNRSRAIKELRQINREAVKATLKKLDAPVIKKYQEKLSLDIKQRYSKISLMPENRKQLKKIMDESSRYLKSKLYAEAARQDIFKEDLKNDPGMDRPDLNTKEGGNRDFESGKKTIEKLEKIMDNLVEKSDELDSKTGSERLNDYKNNLGDIRETIKKDLTDFEKPEISGQVKEMAGLLPEKQNNNASSITNMDQLKDEYKKTLDEIVENIADLNFKSAHPESIGDGLAKPDGSGTALDSGIKNKIDKSADISTQIAEKSLEVSLEEEMSNQLFHYDSKVDINEVENSKEFAYTRHPGDSTDPTSPLKYGKSQGMGADSSKFPAPRYQDTRKGARTAGAGSGGGKENGVAYGNGFGEKREGDEKFTKFLSTTATGMSFRPAELMEFMKKFGNRTRAFNSGLNYSKAWGEATTAVRVAYNYPKYVYISEDQKSQIDELIKKNERENNKKELRFYSSFPAYARIPYQPHDIKINGDLSEWGELDNPIQMQYSSENGHDELSNGVKLYMRWNESGFYFCYITGNTNKIVLPDEVEDDYDAATKDVTQDKCDGDTFEFWIDQAEQQEATIWGIKTRELTLSPFVSPGLYIEYFLEGYKHIQLEDDSHIRITNRITPAGYIVEAFLSRDVLAVKSALHPKMQLVCNFSINQGADWGPRSTQWSASRTVGTKYRPNTWGCIELMGYKPEIEVKDYNQEGSKSEFIFPGQALKIYIRDPERINDASRLELIPAYIGIAGNEEKKKINLIETEKGSGLYCASINTRDNENTALEEALFVKPGDILYVEYSKYDDSSASRIFNQKYCLYVPVVNSFFTTMK